MPNRLAWLFRMFAVVIGSALALLISELGLRAADTFGWVDDWRTTRIALTSSIWTKSWNRDLIYQHRPNFVRAGTRFTEAHGILRPVDVSVDRKPGSLRIAGLGDSVAAAIKLPYEDRVYSVLERILATRMGDDVEVLNFSVNGYSTAQEAASLDELASVFRPDAIVLQYCVNDFYPIIARVAGRVPRDLARRVGRRRCPQPARTCIDAWTRRRIQVLDLLSAYSTHPVETLRFEKWDTYHPSPLGHRIAADAIADALSTLRVRPARN